MRICICGGGALGTVCAGIFTSLENVSVNIYTQHPGNWSKTLKIKDSDSKIFEGLLDIISNNPKIATCNCDIILLCLPGFLIEETLNSIKPYINDSVIIGSIVSSTGFFFQAHNILPPKTKLFGFQRVPFIARIIKYGKEAALLGYKKNLYIATENIEKVENFKQQIEKLFLTPTRILNNFYEACLTNSNPILHTGRLYSMWHTWEGEVFNNCSYFYKDWDEESSKTIIAMDKEFMNLLDILPVDKKQIPQLLDYYESKDAKSLTLKISSIPAFQSILSPMKQVNNGWIPDFNSRYFTEDFPFGLHYIKALANQYQISIPTIEKVYYWGINKINYNV